MDMPSQALKKVRGDVITSRAWSRLQRELLAQMTGGHLRTFGSLSTSDKLAAVERAVEAVGETAAYARLRAHVATSVDYHFSPLLFQPPGIAQEFSATAEDSSTMPRAHPEADPLAEACSRLLEASPHLKHSLKCALNHPLPHGLRLAAWRALLSRPDVQKDFLVAGKELQPGDESKKEISRRCRHVLGENPVFRELAGSSVALSAMQAVVLYWMQRASGEVLDSELLLSVPFVHVWREELERQVDRSSSSKGEARVIFAEIAAEYVHFMEMLPPSVSSSATESADGMKKFARRVEELLQTEDPQLHQALGKAFKKTGGSPKKDRRAWGNPFHHTLKSILFPHIQKMLVGDVSMDVVCYIWDQCFIGLDVPEYQCLPYFTTVWLLLLRDRLLRAKSVANCMLRLWKRLYQVTLVH
ncbi:hypothetical protein GBAR_LOCUS24428 [Geodia barretti]|uniref:Uncharacterized protein n=1 Tax=Geodia barretti TaxID=519541 RepID=A0AA35TA21_GEOBA|nr:hypothetical protein GBAR_LOCUS24428 [Geodia barretti]